MSMIRSFNSLRTSISTASSGERPSASASSGAVRVTVLLCLFIEQFLQSLPSQLNFRIGRLSCLLREGVEDQDAANVPRDVQDSICPGCVLDPQLFHAPSYG